jgi:glycerol uptake facilitator-like aquaporin
MLSKQKLSLVLAEFMGTAMLASAVLVVGNMFSLGTAAWYGALTAGVALSLIVGIFGHVSGAHVNPAVTIGLWTLKKIETTNAIVYIAAQILGGASALLFFNYATGINLAAAGSSSFSWSIFWVETVGAALFGMGIASVVSQKLEGYHAAFTIGMSLTLGSLVASTASAGFLNPAVALANNSWDRTLALAPIIGMVVGMNVYMTLIAPSVSAKKSKK